MAQPLARLVLRNAPLRPHELQPVQPLGHLPLAPRRPQTSDDPLQDLRLHAPLLELHQDLLGLSAIIHDPLTAQDVVHHKYYAWLVQWGVEHPLQRVRRKRPWRRRRCRCFQVEWRWFDGRRLVRKGCWRRARRRKRWRGCYLCV